MTTSIFRLLASVTTAVLIVSAPDLAGAQEAATIEATNLTGAQEAATIEAIDEALVYPGSNCFVRTGGTPTYTSTGRIVNNTASNMFVQCPMYDNGFNFTGAVWLIDNSTTANITCSSVVRNPLGNPSTSQTLSTSGNSSSAKTLNFTGPDAAGTFTFRFYNCTLPPTTQVISYRGRAQ